MKNFFLILLASLILFQFSPGVAQAQLSKSQDNLNKALNGTGLTKDLGTNIGTIVKAVLSLVGTIFLLLTIYAGFLWMTAQGDDSKISKSKSILQAAIIGLVIVMSAYAITYFITSKVGGAATGTGTDADNLSSCSGQCTTPSGGSACQAGWLPDTTGYCADQNQVCCVLDGSGNL